MRLKTLLLLPILFAFVGCQDPDKENTWIQLSETVFNDVNSEGEMFKVKISCISTWTATSNDPWCILNTQEGHSNDELSINIGANIGNKPRSATVDIKSGNTTKTIQINQCGATSIVDNYHYKIPIIFHVLYKSKANYTQYVNEGRLAEILKNINTIYENSSVDMNLEFVLATHNPNGDKLEEPGVERIMWDQEYPIDCEKFMSSNSHKYKSVLWEPNQYINVMVYNFLPDPGSDLTTLGIAHFPFTTSSHNLAGLNNSKYSQLSLANLDYAHCISINSLYVYRQSSKTEYDPLDANITLAHELGHYLGLHHAFSESDKCEDTDYCEDTPTYNREYYNASLDYNKPFHELVIREDCTKGKFISHNVMDYSISYSDQFSDDQRKRIRHVLTYSPLIPGPKIIPTKGLSPADGIIDLPFRVIK